MACAFCYYGVVFLTTEIFEQNDANDRLLLRNQSEFSVNNNSLVGNATMDENGYINGVCHAERDSCMLTTKDYVDLLWITLAEFPGKLLPCFEMEIITIIHCGWNSHWILLRHFGDHLCSGQNWKKEDNGSSISTVCSCNFCIPV